MRLILMLFAIIKSGAMVLANKRSFWNFAKNYRALKGYPKITLDLSIINLGTQKFLLCRSYLIIVIFFTLTQFLENKIYTQKRQFFALNL